MAEAALDGVVWPALVPELSVTDLPRSLWFWRDLVGFRVLHDRPEEGFAYLERAGAHLMLDLRGGGPAERAGLWETGPMQPPFGRGINLQLEVSRLDDVLRALSKASWPLFFGPEERWYRAGAVAFGQRQALVQDPDGYLLRLAESLGERPADAASSS